MATELYHLGYCFFLQATVRFSSCVQHVSHLYSPVTSSPVAVCCLRDGTILATPIEAAVTKYQYVISALVFVLCLKCGVSSL